MQKLLFLSLCTIFSHSVFSQKISFTIEKNSLIYDKVSGEKIPYERYQELQKKESGGYRLDPVFNEFAEIESFKLRIATEEERAANITTYNDLTNRPKIGETMPLFIMKGIDGKIYQSADLKGKLILLSFWMKISRPFWNPSKAEEIENIIKPFKATGDFISLGIMDESKESLEKYLASQALPFISIPDSYAFHKKFNILSVPSFIVIDKSGKVAGFIEGQEFEQLKKVLEQAK